MSAAPEMAMMRTWLRTIGWRMIGSSVAAGNVVIAWTAAVTSSSTRWASAPSSISSRTDALPGLAVDWIRLMPWMPWTASSTRRTTPVSTSSGAAPR